MMANTAEELYQQFCKHAYRCSTCREAMMYFDREVMCLVGVAYWTDWFKAEYAKMKEGE